MKKLLFCFLALFIVGVTFSACSDKKSKKDRTEKIDRYDDEDEDFDEDEDDLDLDDLDDLDLDDLDLDDLDLDDLADLEADDDDVEPYTPSASVNIDELLNDMEKLVSMSEEVKASQDVAKAGELMQIALDFQKKYKGIDDSAITSQMTSRQLKRFQELTERMNAID